MFNKLFRRYPACTFIGTISTGLFLKSADDPFFFLNAWEERGKFDKERQKFENVSLINTALVLWPSNLKEYFYFILSLYYWGPGIEKYFGRKILLATIPVNALVSHLSIWLQSKGINNTYIYSLPLTWTLLNLLINPRLPNPALNAAYFTLAILVLQIDKDPRIGAVSYMIMKFILKYYVKGPLITYL